MKIASIQLLIFLCCYKACAQRLYRDREYLVAAIGFWNVENLYDTLNDKWKNDEDFTPDGVNSWNGERYRTKIDRLSEVINVMAGDVSPDGLSILGLCEIENARVVQDLASSPKLKSRNYKVIHIEGPDARGIDPCLLYNPKYFSPARTLVYHVGLATDPKHKTRDILVVGGYFLGEPLTVLVNHWPSRRGGEKESRVNRKGAAQIARRITDSVSKKDPATRIVIMGDFNDDPLDESVKKGIGTYGEFSMANDTAFFNPMEKPFRQGIGTLAWQDSWNLFDQILLNRKWLPGEYKNWQYFSVQIFNKDFLRNDFGRFKGYPHRTYSGSVYTGGYSDHFPVYILVAKTKNKNK